MTCLFDAQLKIISFVKVLLKSSFVSPPSAFHPFWGVGTISYIANDDDDDGGSDDDVWQFP